MSVFSHLDSNKFLKERLKTFPQNGRGQLTAIAKKLKIHNAWLSAILSGERHFTQEQAFLLSQFLGLSTLETKYYLLLINFERASTPDLRAYYNKELEALRADSLQLAKRVREMRALTEEERSIFYSSWLYSAAHLYSTTKKNGITLNDLCERFKVSKANAAKVLSFLTETGFCEEKNGYYHHRPQSTFVEKGSPHLVRHHLNCRMKAMQKAESLAEEELMFSSQLSLARKDFKLFREKLAVLISDLAKAVKDSPAEDVALFNLDFFWVD
jgi:uncharacterized protein (TIGR02147 family)